MSSLRIVYVIAVVFMLFLAQASIIHALVPRWPDLNLSYRIDQNCKDGFRDLHIRYGIANWVMWLPELNLTEVLEKEQILFTCPMHSGIDPAICGTSEECIVLPPSGNFTHVEIRLGLYAFSSRADLQQGTNAVCHEIGHALGLEDMSGGLMGYVGMNWIDTKIVIPPTSEQVTEIRAAYGLTVPEFPTPILWFLIALFAFWTPIMRRKVH